MWERWSWSPVIIERKSWPRVWGGEINHFQELQLKRQTCLPGWQHSFHLGTRSLQYHGNQRRLLIPVLEASLKSEDVCNAEMDIEAIKDWRILFLDFLNIEDSLTTPQRRSKSEEGLPILFLNAVLYRWSLDGLLLRSIVNHEAGMSGVHSAYAKLTSLDQSVTCSSKGWDTTGPPWSKTA